MKKSNGQQEQSIGVKSEQCVGKAISQVVKFCNVAKIHNLQILLLPASLFFWFLLDFQIYLNGVVHEVKCSQY